MAGDLLASIKPRSVEDIAIGDRSFHIPACAAYTWLDILLEDTWSLSDIVPGLLERDDTDGPYAMEHVSESLITGALTAADYEELVYEVIGLAAGRPWWTALRLLYNATSAELGDWTRAQLVLHHIDATRLSFAAWLDALYGIYTQNMDQQRRAQWDAQLARPVTGGPKPKLNRKQQRAAFAAVMGS